MNTHLRFLTLINTPAFAAGPKVHALLTVSLLMTGYSANAEPLLPQLSPVQASIEVNVDKALDATTALLREIKTKPAVVEKSISGCVQSIRAETKLVVATVEIAATAYRYFENKDYLGASVVGRQLVVVSSPENRVQFFVNLDSIKPVNLSINKDDFALRMVVPRPVLDKKMISIENDKIATQWVKGGIAPTPDAFLMKIVDEVKTKDLPAEVLKQAQSSTITRSVEDAGKRAVEELLRKFLMNDRLFGKMPWLKIEVVYDEQNEKGSLPSAE
jgi:hypothetical protein